MKMVVVDGTKFYTIVLHVRVFSYMYRDVVHPTCRCERHHRYMQIYTSVLVQNDVLCIIDFICNVKTSFLFFLTCLCCINWTCTYQCDVGHACLDAINL